jgi:hypothetical protein
VQTSSYRQQPFPTASSTHLQPLKGSLLISGMLVDDEHVLTKPAPVDKDIMHCIRQ